MFKPWTICVIEIRDSFFFSWHTQPPLGWWLCTLQCEWINILLRTPSIWFLLDRNALRFSLHLAESVAREIQKPKRSVIIIIIFWNFFLVASLRFSLVYLFPLKSSFPIILFRFLETNFCWNQSSYAMNVPLTFIIFLRR